MQQHCKSGPDTESSLGSFCDWRKCGTPFAAEITLGGPFFSETFQRTTDESNNENRCGTSQVLPYEANSRRSARRHLSSAPFVRGSTELVPASKVHLSLPSVQPLSVTSIFQRIQPSRGRRINSFAGGRTEMGRPTVRCTTARGFYSLRILFFNVIRAPHCGLQPLWFVRISTKP